MHFTIDRQTWRFGGAAKYDVAGPTCLLNNEGFMCCLGHIGLQLGAAPDDILHRSIPATVHRASVRNAYAEHLGMKLTDKAMLINDDSSYPTNEDREDDLKSLFLKYEHTIEFVG